jgi:hypothetical protein
MQTEPSVGTGTSSIQPTLEFPRFQGLQHLAQAIQPHA